MSLGLAMIARNAEAWLPDALEPFIGVVDEMAVVLGGVNSDGTERAARGYTGKVSHYDGPIDEEGRLLDFGVARQQSFDLLTTRWAVVVDTDDLWVRTDQLPKLIEFAEEQGAHLVSLPYYVEGLEMTQPRIYRRDAGHWEMPIHEYFHIDIKPPKGIKTDWVGIRQRERKKDHNLGRIRQNISIASRYLETNGEDRHMLAHLGKDLVSLEQYEEAMAIFDRYQALAQQNGRNGDGDYKHPEELASILYHRAGTEFLLERYHAALYSVLAMLAIRDYAPGWALLSEIYYTLGSKTPALYELAVFAADQALSRGRTRGGFAVDNLMSLRGALQIKAEALMKIGKLSEARAALDLGLMVDPGHVDLTRLRQQVCSQLQEVP